MKLYKVLIEGKSCHGGNLSWPLPKSGRPGDWVSIDESAKLKLCSSGIHLCEHPWKDWAKWGCDVYEAEGYGERLNGGDKIAFRKARLISRVEAPSWWQEAESFVNSIPKVSWFSVSELPRGIACKRFESRAAATWSSVARNAAWDAAKSASLMAVTKITKDLEGLSEQTAYANDLWSIWESGWGCLGKLGDTFYVYKK